MLRSANFRHISQRIYIPGLSSQCLQKSNEEQLTGTSTNVLGSEQKNCQLNRYEILGIFRFIKNNNNLYFR